MQVITVLMQEELTTVRTQEELITVLVQEELITVLTQEELISGMQPGEEQVITVLVQEELAAAHRSSPARSSSSPCSCRRSWRQLTTEQPTTVAELVAVQQHSTVPTADARYGG